MRKQLLKLKKSISTKAERKFSEILKSHRIKFLTKYKVNGKEIDFIVGKYAIEIDGHKQNESKNSLLVECGFIPIHISNDEVSEDKLKELINILNKCQAQDFHMD